MHTPTPTPWETTDKPYIIGNTGDGDQFSGGDWIIYPPMGESGPVAIANSQANAALIVRAVNERQGLIEALRAAVDWLKPRGHALGCYAIHVKNGYCNCGVEKILEQMEGCEAALKAAEGR